VVQRILDDPLSEFNNRSLYDLMHDKATDFVSYVGFTALLDVALEAFKFLSTRGASLPRLKNGTQPRNRHVLARGAANTTTSGATHFTDKEAQTELGLKYVVVCRSNIKCNAFAVEEALQRALLHITMGRRLWRWVAMGQKEAHTLPNDVNVYKVFFTFSFDVQAAMKANKCIVIPWQLSTLAPCSRRCRCNL